MVVSESFLSVWLGSPQSWGAACGGPWAMFWCFGPEKSWTVPEEAMSQEKKLLPQLMNKKLAKKQGKIVFLWRKQAESWE